MSSYLFNVLSNRVTLLILSITSSFLLVNQNYFPFFGWTIFGIIYVGAILVAKPRISFSDWFFAIISVLTCVNFTFKTSLLVLFFFFCLYVYSTSWLISKAPKNLFYKVLHLIFPFVKALLEPLITRDTLPKLIDSKQKTNQNTKLLLSNLPKYAINSGITLIVLAIIIPLLSYSNPYFGSFFTQLINTIERFIQDIFSFSTIFRIFVAIFLYNFLPRLICFCRQQTEEVEESQEFDLTFPKFAVVITLSAFLIAQVQTYFNPKLIENTAGKIANEIFFHLSVVCLVIFILILINLKNKLFTKIASWILILQTFLLSLIAFNSDWNYYVNWGLTHKRLYGFAVVCLVISIILVFIFSLIKKVKYTSKYIALSFCLIFGITNLINFDYLIYKNPPLELRDVVRVELNYISAMNLDSYSLNQEYQKQYPKYLELNKSGNYDYRCAEVRWFDSNSNQIRYLQNKYSSIQLLSFNYNEYANWLTIKDTKLPSIELYKKNNQLEKPSFNDNCYNQYYQVKEVSTRE
jgi:Domain of unknown function (DUF4173)